MPLSAEEEKELAELEQEFGSEEPSSDLSPDEEKELADLELEFGEKKAETPPAQPAEEPGMISKAASEVVDFAKGTGEKIVGGVKGAYELGKLALTPQAPLSEEDAKDPVKVLKHKGSFNFDDYMRLAPEDRKRYDEMQKSDAKANVEVAAKNFTRGMSALEIPPGLEAEAEKQVAKYGAAIPKNIQDILGMDTTAVYENLYKDKPTEELAAANVERDVQMNQERPLLATASNLAGVGTLAAPAVAVMGPTAALGTIAASKSGSKKYQETGSLYEAGKEGAEDAAANILLAKGIEALPKAKVPKTVSTPEVSLPGQTAVGNVLEKGATALSERRMNISPKKAAEIRTKPGQTAPERRAEIAKTLNEEGINSAFGRTGYFDRIKAARDKHGKIIENSLNELDDAVNQMTFPDQVAGSELSYVPKSGAQARVVRESVDTRPLAQPGKYQRRFDDVEDIAAELSDEGITPGMKRPKEPENIDGIYRQVETAIQEGEPSIIQIDKVRRSTQGRVDPKAVVQEFREQMSKNDLSVGGPDFKVEMLLQRLEDSGPMSLTKSNDLIRGIDKLAKFGQQTVPEQAEQMRILRSIFNKHADRTAAQAAKLTGKQSVFDKFTNSNKKYGDLKDAGRLSSNASPEGLDILGLKTVTKYGDRVVTPALNKLSKMVKAAKINPHTVEIPPIVSKHIKTLQTAVERGGNSLAATNYILSQQDPEYRQWLEQQEEEGQ